MAVILIEIVLAHILIMICLGLDSLMDRWGKVTRAHTRLLIQRKLFHHQIMEVAVNVLYRIVIHQCLITTMEVRRLTIVTLFLDMALQILFRSRFHI